MKPRTVSRSASAISVSPSSINCWIVLVVKRAVAVGGDQVAIEGGDRVLVFNTRRGVADVKRAFTAA